MRIGIDLGGTKIEGIVLDTAGQELARLRRPTPQQDGYAAIIETVVAIVRELERTAGPDATIGVGMPGAFSRRTGLVKNSNTQCLNGRPFELDLERALGRSIVCENDANCFALSEARDGAGRGYRVVFGVILGTGVGGGIVIDGSIHRGPNHVAGEWGHSVFDRNELDPIAADCYCGKRGCVETVLCGAALRADHLAQQGGDAALEASAIAAAAARGDAGAGATLARYGARLGRALANVVNVLDPDVIVLGGGLSAIPSLPADARAALGEHIFGDAFDTPIVRNQHGDSSGVRGAAWLGGAK
ncbi:MAG: ROK family protein [Planctomycetota bacterium]